jgi:hypothetical protein
MITLRKLESEATIGDDDVPHRLVSACAYAEYMPSEQAFDHVRYG